MRTGWFLKARKNYKSCATTEYRWLFRGSPSSLRNLWSCCYQATESSCARWSFARALPARSPRNLGSLADFAVSVFGWKWVKVLCLLGATLEVLNLIHEKCLRMLPILHPRDYLWTPSTPGDLASGFPLLVGCPNFDIVLWFWGAITSASRCLL